MGWRHQPLCTVDDAYSITRLPMHGYASGDTPTGIGCPHSHWHHREVTICCGHHALHQQHQRHTVVLVATTTPLASVLHRGPTTKGRGIARYPSKRWGCGAMHPHQYNCDTTTILWKCLLVELQLPHVLPDEWSCRCLFFAKKIDLGEIRDGSLVNITCKHG